LITILLSIFSFFFFFLLFIDDKSPRLLFSITNIFDPPLTKLNLDNFGFGFSLQDPITYDQFIDESIYYPLVFQMTGTRVNKGNETVFEWSVIPMELERCTINKFPISYHDIMKDLPFNEYYCMKNPEFEIAGTFLFSSYKYLMIKLFECTNSTDISSRRVNRPRMNRILKQNNDEEDHFDFSGKDYEDPNDIFGIFLINFFRK
jgi:hypothetical protein